MSINRPSKNRALVRRRSWVRAEIHKNGRKRLRGEKYFAMFSRECKRRPLKTIYEDGTTHEGLTNDYMCNFRVINKTINSIKYALSVFLNSFLTFPMVSPISMKKLDSSQFWERWKILGGFTFPSFIPPWSSPCKIRKEDEVFKGRLNTRKFSLTTVWTI